MPSVRLVIFQNCDGSAPFLVWFLGLERKTQVKCKVRLDFLAREGFNLRRPVADFLRDGVYELRLKSRGMNYRVLYFFHGRETVVISHGFSKQGDKVPPREIKRAINNMMAFTRDPAKHSFEQERPWPEKKPPLTPLKSWTRCFSNPRNLSENCEPRNPAFILPVRYTLSESMPA